MFSNEWLEKSKKYLPFSAIIFTTKDKEDGKN